MSLPLPASTRIHHLSPQLRAFPFVLRWHADDVVAAAALRLVQPRPWQATAGHAAEAAANANAAPARIPARLHRYLPAPPRALFRIR